MHTPEANLSPFAIGDRVRLNIYGHLQMFTHRDSAAVVVGVVGSIVRVQWDGENDWTSLHHTFLERAQ